MDRDLSFGLHALTARLDRAADRILQSEHNVSYRRFLALFTIRESGPTTQRALAERLGITEPSVSRMTGVLAESGLLDADPHPTGGNRRRLALTSAGEELVAQCYELLEDRLAALVEHSGVPYRDYARHTKQLLAALDGVQVVAGRPGATVIATEARSATEGRPA